MAVSIRQILESLSTHGILTPGELTSLREANPDAKADADAEQFVRDLVKQGKLTKFQATNLYQGRAKGLVFGEYVLLDKIGAGGMGQVYKAQHKRMKRIVALKVLPAQLVKSPKSVQRFYQEVEVAAKLTHPNIVTAYDAGEAHGMHYLVMEYVEGKDLSSYVAKNGPLSLEQTLNIIIQAAKGFAYAHGLNIVHRDVKPSNLLADRQGVVKILDMGLARVVGPLGDAADGDHELTAGGEVMGTMDFMAPEQAVDTRSADHRADIYSLGCTLYRLYVGKPVFDGDTAVKKILAHRDKPIPSLRTARPDTPEAVDRIFRKMLAKNPADRVQSMTAVIEALENLTTEVDDEKSVVRLGTEMIDRDAGHMLSGMSRVGSSGIGGGSSLDFGGGSSIGSRHGAGEGPAPSFAGVQVAVDSKSKGKQRSESIDTDSGGPTRALGSAGGKPSIKLPRLHKSKTALIGGGVLVLFMAAGAVVLLRSGGDPEAPTDLAGTSIAGAAPAGLNIIPPTDSKTPGPKPTASATAGVPPVRPATPAGTINFQSDSTTTTGSPPSSKPVPALTADVNLLPLIDPELHARNSFWSRDGDAVVCGLSGTGVHVIVPYSPPADYDLVCEVVPPLDNSQFGCGLVIGDAQPLLVVNQSGIGMHVVDGRNWNDAANPTFQRGSRFFAEKPVRMECAVRGKRIVIRIDGTTVVDFTDNLGRLTKGDSFAAAAPGQFYLNGSEGVRYTKLTISPPRMSLDTPAAAVAAQSTTQPTELTAEVDLLALVDPVKHGQHGRWYRDGTAVVLDLHAGPGPRFIVPFTPPAEYDLTLVAVPTKNNISFGPGLAVDGRNVTLMVNDDKYGLRNIDGRSWTDGNNPTYRSDSRMFFRTNDVVTIVCSVRQGRVFATMNGRPIVDFDDSSRFSHVGELGLQPGTLHVAGEGGTRITRLTIGPPTVSLPSSSGNVNLAASFNGGNVVAGIGTSVRGGIQFQAEPNKHARLAFSAPVPEQYVVTAVVERTTGGDMFGLGLPLGPSRTVAIIDTRMERFCGLHSVPPGGVDINPTGRRYGWQLTPGEQHVVHAVVETVPQGRRVRLSLNGREIVDYAGNSFFEDQSHSVPDRRAIAAVTWSSGWRIVRLDLASADGRLMPVPDSAARTQATAELGLLTKAADAKGASLEDVLLAVDNLRRKAAGEREIPAVRYAALDEALRIATAAGDLSGAYESAADLTTAFDVDPQPLQARVIESFKAPRSLQAEAKRQFADEAFKLMDRTAKNEQWEYALELNGAIDKAFGATNTELKRELKARAAEYAFVKSLSEPAVAAREKVAAGEPLDPQSAAALGTYLCFGSADWPSGLKWLAQGEGELASIAKLERGDLTTGEARFALAEAWWAMSEKERTMPLKWAAAERASLWYRRAAGVNLADKTRSLLQRRMTTLVQLRRNSGGVGGPRRPADAVKIGDHWYKAFATPMQWETAVQTCEQLGGNLVIIDTPAENQAVAQLMLQQLGSQAAERASCWLGVSDAEEEGVFRRLDGVVVPSSRPPLGGPPPFVKWAGGEPNNGGGDEDFVAMQVSLQNNQLVSDWNDHNRNAWCYFVCEWDH